MKDDTRDLLDSLLSEWHRWAKGYKHIGGINTTPMFREVTLGRQWDSIADIVDDSIELDTMVSVDAIIMAMDEMHRTSLQIQARNLHTGKSVWCSARLPEDVNQRAVILAEARTLLIAKLQNAGIL